MSWPLRAILIGVFAFVLWLPGWWLARRLVRDGTRPFFRWILSIGLALTGYVGFVNLLGRLLESSFQALGIYFVANAVACGFLIWRGELDTVVSQRPRGWRSWAVPLALALAISVPESLLTLSTNWWDEFVSSAIHITAPNQFSEDVFPPRHNALPDIKIKYHYAFTILSGTVELLAGISPGISIDVASIGLWLFIFLFVFAWLEHLGLKRLAAVWGGTTVLMGGGLLWLYGRSVEIYKGFDKVPLDEDLFYRYRPDLSRFDNLVILGKHQNCHLRNADGTVSSMPLDIANFFLQHGVPVGIALTLVGAYLLSAWLREKGLGLPLLAASAFAFGLIFLGHAVYGAVASLAAGLLLVLRWLAKPSWRRFHQALLFTLFVTQLAFLHGGMMSVGPEYGDATGFVTLRETFGYSLGGVRGFIHWNVAAFGLPLLLSPLAVWAWLRAGRQWLADERGLTLGFFFLFGLISYVVPQLVFYSYNDSSVEQFTEISKFFFCTRLALGVLSAFAISRLLRVVPGALVAVALLATVVDPLLICYGGTFFQNNKWNGIYYTPYGGRGPESYLVKMGKALKRLKKSPWDVYFDASADERSSGFLSELLIYGGSVFTMTPSRYERTGGGYQLSMERVAQRYRENSRIARLLPGAAEELSCNWYYTRPLEDLEQSPLIVRSRFDKLVGEGYLVEKFASEPRSLLSFDRPTADLDRGIERYWRPRVVTQTPTDWDGDGRKDLFFFDHERREIRVADQRLPLPGEFASGEFPLVYVAQLAGDRRADFIVGRMADTFYSTGRTLWDILEYNAFYWTFFDSVTGQWQSEYQHWFWTLDIPLVGDHDADGVFSHLAYRWGKNEWFLAPNTKIEGPALLKGHRGLPVSGHFRPDSRMDLGIWDRSRGELTLQSVDGGEATTFALETMPGDVLVPGDYTGNGLEEAALWRPSDGSWYFWQLPGQEPSKAVFGSPTGVPLPADYDDDGRLDLAYWEPLARTIFVSFDFGQSVGLTIPVPPDSIPVFVNMY